MQIICFNKASSFKTTFPQTVLSIYRKHILIRLVPLKPQKFFCCHIQITCFDKASYFKTISLLFISPCKWTPYQRDQPSFMANFFMTLGVFCYQVFYYVWKWRHSMLWVAVKRTASWQWTTLVPPFFSVDSFVWVIMNASHCNLNYTLWKWIKVRKGSVVYKTSGSNMQHVHPDHLKISEIFGCYLKDAKV